MQSYCLSVQFYQWGECAAPGNPVPAFKPSACQGWDFYREGASLGWSPRAGAIWNKPAFQASLELSPFPLRPKATAARGSGAWPEARALTLTPSGPGFACCGVCHCVRWTELSLETPSFRKVQSLTPIFPFSQRCHQEGEVLWLAVAVPTPETGSCLRRKRVEKGHSPVPTSGPCLRHPFHNQGSFCWASREQLGWGPETQEEIHSRPRPQPTQDRQWYMRYPVEWGQEMIADQKWGEKNGTGQCGSWEH